MALWTPLAAYPSHCLNPRQTVFERMPKLLDILLQRNDPGVPWGFQVRGGLDFGSHPVISSVTFGTLAAQYLSAGDKILQIDNHTGDSLLQSEVEALVRDDQPTLQLLVEKTPMPPEEPREVLSEQEWIREKGNGRKSTRIRLRETNRNPSLGDYDLQVNFERTKYGDGDSGKSRNGKRLEGLSENFDRIFRERIGEWLELNMLDGRQQSNTNAGGDGNQGVQPPPPPPPSFPGAIPGRRLKTEIPERGLEPPSVIQNAMMTKDKKPFTYTPGGLDLSEIRSPKMQRRINRNACADEMPGIPAPTTNQPPPVSPPANTHFAAMQSQLPAQVLPPGAVPPPPPPPPPPGSAPESMPAPPPPPPASAASTLPRPAAGRPPLGFDPNELLARVNKTQPYEPPANNFREEPARNLRQQQQQQQQQSPEEKPVFEPKQQRPNEIGHIYVPLQNEPGHIYVPQVQPRTQTEPPVNHSPRGQLGSLYVPPVASVAQEQSSPAASSSPYGYRAQQNSPSVTSPPAAEAKPQAPWVTVYRTPQSSVPWANREAESPKPPGTRIIPIQIEGRDSPKPTTPSPQPQTTPPPFLQSQQMRQAQQQQQQQQTMRQQPPSQQQSGNTRVIPIQIEGSSQPSANQQSWASGQGYNQNKFNPMTPLSPTPFSPSQEKEQKPQWAPVQPRPFKKEQETNVGQQRLQQQQQQQPPQQPQPEYGTYNTAGVPLSQLRKMQLSDDDRALMDKFKSQVERQGNDILTDENSNPRYRGGYIPSRAFKILDESVDDETYLHRESDPRYRGAVIPSRAFRMLQSMTDTAGEMPQQVPRSQSRGPTARPLSGTQFQPQEQQQQQSAGPYVPPSEQQAQEPRKYTGGSIPSRSFKMLQAMTGQEVSAPNPSGSPSGRETPVAGINRWCPSPSPSPVDPFWGYYPPDPYFIYNYLSDLNAAYGLPPPPPPPVYPQPPAFHPYHFHPMYQSYSSDIDEQGYSSTDELAQYYANYRRNFGYSPYQPNPERYCNSTPNSFNVPRVCVTPVQGGQKPDPIEKGNKLNRLREEREQQEAEAKAREQNEEHESPSSTEDESESDTEVEEDESSPKVNGLSSLKSVSNVSVYTSESASTVVQGAEEVGTSSSEEEEEEETEAKEEPIPHQLSVIFEESEHSDVESVKRQDRNRGCPGTISESESCSTLDNGEDDSDNDVLDAESSVTVRLPLKFKFTRSDNDEDIATVIVGDSQVQTETLYNLNPPVKEPEKTEEEESYESEEGDVSVTFTLPSRSNSVISVEHSLAENKEESPREENVESGEPEVETEVTVCISLSKVPEAAEEEEPPHLEHDSSSTSVQSGDTVLKHKEDDSEEESEEEEADKPKARIEKENSKDWNETNKTAEARAEGEDTPEDNSYKAGVGRLEEMISSLLETTRDTMSTSMELLQKDLESKTKSDSGTTLLRKKDSQEESEEDDSGVTSDMSIKQLNSETDADTESDYSELSKMTKFQRASTHSRLFKLLQEECEKSGHEDEDEDAGSAASEPPKEEAVSLRKQKLTLPLTQSFPSEAESLSSSSGIASPSSPTVSDRLVKELIHSLLNKKKGKKFRKLPLAKLHAAAVRILQEEMDPYDTSPTSGDDFLSPMQKKFLHSKLTAKFGDSDGSEPQCLEPVPESIYGENYYDYLDYYNTWGNPETCDPEDYDIVPSRAFRMLRERTNSPKPFEGFIARCPRVSSRKSIHPEPSAGRQTPVVSGHRTETRTDDDDDPKYEEMTFAEKQEKVSKVLEKSGKT